MRERQQESEERRPATTGSARQSVQARPGVTRAIELPGVRERFIQSHGSPADDETAEFSLTPGSMLLTPARPNYGSGHKNGSPEGSDFIDGDFLFDEEPGDPNVADALPAGDSNGGGNVSLGESDSSDSASPNAPVLGEYVVGRKIGSGGMGQVFQAKHRTMDREVALKILPRSMSTDPIARDRFYAEVRATAKLMHPNIVTAFDAGCYKTRTNEVHYLVMELIHGDILSQRVIDSGPLSTQSVVDILVQAASALEYAHSKGIVHRDIKPSNMMLTESGTLKILDFGLAVLRDQFDASTDPSKSQIVGTVEFMAPEQINTPDKVDHRCDLYSLGATVFYLLTGRPMFSGELVQTALAQVHRRPPALYEVRGDVDIRLDSVFQSLVAKNPNERLQSASDLTEKLIKLNLLERKSDSYKEPDARSLRSTPIKNSSFGPTHFGIDPSTSQRQLASIGIELGMISSQVNYINDEHKVEEVLVDGDSQILRNMLFSEGERIAVGAQAAEFRVNKPDHIFYGMQRWYGLPLLERPFGGRQVPPEVLVATVIRQMLNATRHKLPSATHAVVTVPACYDQMHRISTKTACSIAGIELLQLLDKPLAATLAHVEIDSRLAKLKDGASYHRTFMVVMLTGEACEVSLVGVDGLQVHMLANVGDWKKGTVRWHDRMAKKIASEIETRFGASAREDRSLASKIQRTVERVFDRLRTSASVPFVVEVPGGKFESKLERDRVEEWVGDLSDDCGSFAEEVLARSKLSISQIDGVLLLGDVRWLPEIKSRIAKIVGKNVPMIPLSTTMLARGAALQAEFMMPPLDKKSPHAVACSSYDLGVIMQESDSLMPPKTLVAKDTPLPYQGSRTLRFARKGDRQPILQFAEGSRLGASTWNKLGSIDLETCFPNRREADPLQLRLEIDESGLWQGVVSWPAGNDQIALSPLNEPTMDVVSSKQWRDWLESLMLCNG